MLHIRYDWRRPLLWASLCLVFFLGSEKLGNRKAAANTNDVAKVDKMRTEFLGRKWVK